MQAAMVMTIGPQPQTPQLLLHQKVPHLLRAPHATAHRAADRPDPNLWKLACYLLLLYLTLDRAHDPPWSRSVKSATMGIPM